MSLPRGVIEGLERNWTTMECDVLCGIANGDYWSHVDGCVECQDGMNGPVPIKLCPIGDAIWQEMEALGRRFYQVEG